jgi:hypothetical protein
MIELNGKKFARTEIQFLNSLFTGPNTCSGYYTVNQNSITLKDQVKARIGVIKDGKCLSAAKEDGKWVFFDKEPEIVGQWRSAKTMQADLEAIAKEFNLPVIKAPDPAQLF